MSYFSLLLILWLTSQTHNRKIMDITIKFKLPSQIMEIQLKSEDQQLIDTLKRIHFSLPCGIQQRETTVTDRRLLSYMFLINRVTRVDIRTSAHLVKRIFLQISEALHTSTTGNKFIKQTIINHQTRPCTYQKVIKYTGTVVRKAVK